MVLLVGLEPTASGFEVLHSIHLSYRSIISKITNKKQLIYKLLFVLEQVVGIEPTFPAWKAGVLPIYDTCIIGADEGSRTLTPLGARS